MWHGGQSPTSDPRRFTKTKRVARYSQPHTRPKLKKRGGRHGFSGFAKTAVWVVARVQSDVDESDDDEDDEDVEALFAPTLRQVDGLLLILRGTRPTPKAPAGRAYKLRLGRSATRRGISSLAGRWRLRPGRANAHALSAYA